MTKWTMIVTAGGLVVAAALAVAQPPRGGPGQGPGPGGPDDLVSRMMEFDQDKDGKLTRAEVTDARLHRLFDQADADGDGTVTTAELNVLQVRERAKDRAGRPGGGPGGPPGGGPGGPMMGMGRPGVILPPMLQQVLKLTPEQKQQIDDLQRDVDARLERVLSGEQMAQLKELRERGPGRFGPPGGGPPGGGPPGGRRPGGGGPPPPPDRPQ